MQEETSSNKILIIATASLVIGGVVGYFWGNAVGVKQGVLQEQATLVAEQKKAADAAAESANPFVETSANPFEETTVNPYNNVKVNPFE